MYGIHPNNLEEAIRYRNRLCELKKMRKELDAFPEGNVVVCGKYSSAYLEPKELIPLLGEVIFLLEKELKEMGVITEDNKVPVHIYRGGYESA